MCSVLWKLGMIKAMLYNVKCIQYCCPHESDIKNLEKSMESLQGASINCSRSVIWSGVIAKRGSPVCRARCVPIGNGFESLFPEVVDCSSRTNVDELARQYNKASGFGAVCFYPDSGEDVGPFNKFVNYFTEKGYIGVSECTDGTYLFLVPPSDFITNTLKSTDPRGLYGVVFKSLRRPIEDVLSSGSGMQTNMKYLRTLELARTLIQSGQVTIDSGTAIQNGQVTMDSGTAILNGQVVPNLDYGSVIHNPRFLPTLEFARSLVQLTQKLIQTHSRRNQQ